MIIQPYDYFRAAWLILAGSSTAYFIYDRFANSRVNVHSTVRPLLYSLAAAVW